MHRTLSRAEELQVTELRLRKTPRDAVEILVRAFDRVDRETGGRLLEGVDEEQLYDGAVTAWMRLVFLLAAEERGLLAAGHPVYDAHYAASTLGDELRDRVEQKGEADLRGSHDAWARLLATFEAVFAGVEREGLRLSAHGGALFDPGRFPFLEGRARDTRRRAEPRTIDDRTTWRVLAAARTLGTLEVEQIGHVYESLIGREARRAVGPVIGITGTGGAEPHVSIFELEELRAHGRDQLVTHLARVSGRGKSAAALRTLGRALDAEVTPRQLESLRAACADEGSLTARIVPWAGLLRVSQDGRPVVVPPGALYVTDGRRRRTSGSHYTPRSLTEPLVRQALEPLCRRSARELLELSVCDLATGSGAFLVQVCRELADYVVEAWNVDDARLEDGRQVPEGPEDPEERRLLARRLVAERCLHGVDLNPTAVEIAKLCLWLTTRQRDQPFTFLDHALRVGDGLVGDAAEPREGDDGFDAIVGNPPWMTHAKRAAVPISAARREELKRRYPGFSAYPTTHGAFLVRAARLLRPGGRLALLLPTSVVDLDGYAGYRAAHDELCVVDAELRSIAEGAFPGVFQPCAFVTSTRRTTAVGGQRGAEWSLARTDLSPAAGVFIRTIAARATLAPECFGERGLTSNVSNRDLILDADGSSEGLPLLAGSDIQEFRLGPPSYRARPSAWPRPDEVEERYARVAVLIRQTARFPIAAVSNGMPFRNSLLAGFATPELSAEALAAWLNSSTIRWLHFMRFRDAREGMPQVKISHLRRIPAPPPTCAVELHELGARLHAEPDEAIRSRLDACVLEALATPREVEREVRAWAAARA